MHALQHSLSCKVWNNITKDAQTACATRCTLIFVYNCWILITRQWNASEDSLPSFPNDLSQTSTREPPFLFSVFRTQILSDLRPLPENGAISISNVMGLWSFRKWTRVSPRKKSTWELRLFLENYSWYFRKTRIVEYYKTTEELGIFWIRMTPKPCDLH